MLDHFQSKSVYDEALSHISAQLKGIDPNSMSEGISALTGPTPAGESLKNFSGEQINALRGEVAAVGRNMLTDDIITMIGNQTGFDLTKPENSDLMETAYQAASLTALMYSGTSSSVKSAAISYARPAGESVKSGHTVRGAIPVGESFDKQSFDETAAMAVLLAPTAAIGSRLQQHVFPVVVMEPSEKLLKMKIARPTLLQPVTRSLDGTPDTYNEVPLIHALRDDTILRTTRNRLYPNPTTANAAYLVDVADVPNFTEDLGGISISTRPMKFGMEVSLISLCKHDGLMDGILDHRDTISNIIGLRSVWLKFTDDQATPVSVLPILDLTNANGAAFTPGTSGLDTGMVMNLDGSFKINLSKFDTTNLRAKLGIDPSDNGFVTVRMELNGKADTQKTTYRVSLLRLELTGVTVVDSGTGVVTEMDIAALSGWTLEGVGLMPKATPVNAVFRTQAPMVQSGIPYVYNLSAELRSPYSSVTPVADANVEGYGASIELLQSVVSVENSSYLHQSLFEQLAVLETLNGSSDISDFPGSMLVREHVYEKEELVLTTMSATRDSVGARANIATSILDAISQMYQKMKQRSDIEAVLTQTGGNAEALELRIVTSSWMKSLMLESGEPRALGNGVKFKIESSPNERYFDKVTGNHLIHMFIFRTDKGPKDPMNFGISLSNGLLVTSTEITYAGGKHNQTLVYPRNHNYILCPVAGELTVVGVETVLLTDQIKLG